MLAGTFKTVPEAWEYAIREIYTRGITVDTEYGIKAKCINGMLLEITEPSQTLEVLKEWVDLGLKEINVSYDDYHLPYLEQFGGEQYVINIMHAARELGISSLIGTVIHPEAKIRTSYLRQMAKDAGITGELQCMEDFLFPLGRARKRLPVEACYREPEQHKEAGCREAGKTVVVLPTGDVTFCCGHIFNTDAQSLITIAKIGEGETLPEIVERMQRNVLYWWLHLRGPFEIAKKVGIENMELRNCEICYLLGTKYKEKLLLLANEKDNIFDSLVSDNVS
jgi:hypothetical protein